MHILSTIDTVGPEVASHSTWSPATLTSRVFPSRCRDGADFKTYYGALSRGWAAGYDGSQYSGNSEGYDAHGGGRQGERAARNENAFKSSDDIFRSVS